MLVWRLRTDWEPDNEVEQKIAKLRCELEELGGWKRIESCVLKSCEGAPPVQVWSTMESKDPFRLSSELVSF